MIIQVKPIIDYSVRGLCVKPYPGHPKGCPNFNHKDGCPPEAALFDEVFDITKPVYAIINRFDLKAHIDKMKMAHPDFTEAQLKCCLYWQNTARKQLTNEIVRFMFDHLDYYVAVAGYRGLDKDIKSILRQHIIPSPPEAMGVNITETMKNVGIILEWPPETIAYQIALAGIKKQEKY